MKEAVEIVEKDPGGNQDLLAKLSHVKDVFDGEARPADQRVFDQELAVVSLSQVIERLQDEVRAGFDAARSTEGGALKMVTGLVQRQMPAMKELRKGQQRVESVLKQVHSKTVTDHAEMGGQLTSIMGMRQKLVDRDEEQIVRSKNSCPFFQKVLINYKLNYQLSKRVGPGRVRAGLYGYGMRGLLNTQFNAHDSYDNGKHNHS